MLRIERLSVAFSGAMALSDVSMTVAQGEPVAVLGANGAGKTTLLRAVMGRVTLAAGSISLDGEAIDGLPTRERVRRGLALCPENRQVFPAMSVEENLLLGAWQASGREAARRRDALFARFAFLAARRRALAGGFSGGEQQIIAIGRALMAAPRLLLLDEPSSGLSPVAITAVRDLLLDIAAAGMAILIVEQNVGLAADLTRRCYVLDRGTVQNEGETSSLAQDPGLADTYLGTGGSQA
jgi:branched-chain amino acid transport system ATP-binding protein